MFQMDQHQMKKWGNPARNLKHSATQRFSSQSFEAVGTVIESADPSFEPGQIVIAHGMGLGLTGMVAWPVSCVRMRLGWCRCRAGSAHLKRRRLVSRAFRLHWLWTDWRAWGRAGVRTDCRYGRHGRRWLSGSRNVGASGVRSGGCHFQT